MGDLNQLEFVRARRASFAPPYLEVGSRDYGTTADLRPLFPGAPYVGVDLEPGAGVDVALDLARPFAEVDAALGGRRFGSIFCLSVLEHCAQPFAMAGNLTRLLAPRGRVYVSVPFAWAFHGYPSDYWRFTHEGVRRLFPDLEFPPEDAVATTARDGETMPLDEDVGQIPLRGGHHRRKGRWLRGLSADLLKGLARVGALRWIAGHRYVLAPTMIHMVGVKRGD